MGESCQGILNQCTNQYKHAERREEGSQYSGTEKRCNQPTGKGHSLVNTTVGSDVRMCFRKKCLRETSQDYAVNLTVNKPGEYERTPGVLEYSLMQELVCVVQLH